MHDKLVLRFAAMVFIYNQPTFLVILFLKIRSCYLTEAVPCRRVIFIHQNYNRAFKRLSALFYLFNICHIHVLLSMYT